MKHESEILKIFVAEGGLMVSLQTPFLQNDHVIASDAHILIRIPKEITEGVYEERTRPSVSQLLSIENRIDMPISFARIKEMYDNLPEIVEREECGACEGDKTVSFEFSYRHHFYETEEECPVCGGVGYLGETGRLIKDPKARICIGSACFDNRYIKIIIDTMRMLDCETIRLVSNPVSVLNIFELKDGIQILLIPVYNN